MDPNFDRVEEQVIRTLLHLSGGRSYEPFDILDIINQVKRQIEDQEPIPELENAIQNYLRSPNHTHIFNRHGPNSFSFGIGLRTLPPKNPRIPRKNFKRRLDGNEDETEPQAKRFRSNMENDKGGDSTGSI